MVDVGDDCNVSQIFSDHNILLSVVHLDFGLVPVGV